MTAGAGGVLSGGSSVFVLRHAYSTQSTCTLLPGKA